MFVYQFISPRTIYTFKLFIALSQPSLSQSCNKARIMPTFDSCRINYSSLYRHFLFDVPLPQNAQYYWATCNYIYDSHICVPPQNANPSIIVVQGLEHHRSGKDYSNHLKEKKFNQHTHKTVNMMKCPHSRQDYE
jgi:hypothetical protein